MRKTETEKKSWIGLGLMGPVVSVVKSSQVSQSQSPLRLRLKKARRRLEDVVDHQVHHHQAIPLCLSEAVFSANNIPLLIPVRISANHKAP
jgi:hypothetical protein